MKQSTPWIGLALVGVALMASPASAQSVQNIWEDVRQLFVEFGNTMYVVGAAGIIAGACWSVWKWHSTREFGEGLGGMAVIAVSAVFVFYVIPKLTSIRPTLSEGLSMVRYVVG